MSVDKELQRAVEEAEENAAVPAVVQPEAPAGPPAPKAKRSVGLLVALLAIGVGVLGLVFSSAEGAAVYSVGVDKLVKEQERYGKRNVKVVGKLVPGTLAKRSEPSCEYRFKLTTGDTVLPVRFPQCIVPDTFRDMPGMDVMVTAEGKLAADGQSFEATGIMAKCPSKYEMKQQSQSGVLAPHAGKQATPLQTLSQKD